MVEVDIELVELVEVDVLDVDVLDVDVLDVDVLDVDVVDVDVELVEVVDPGSEVDVVVVEVDVVGIDVDVVEVEVVEVEVDEAVVVVGLVSVPPSHGGSTAPGEKRTPGPDPGGGMRVGTVISLAPRYQVVANGSTVDAGVVDEVVDVVAADGLSG